MNKDDLERVHKVNIKSDAIKDPEFMLFQEKVAKMTFPFSQMCKEIYKHEQITAMKLIASNIATMVIHMCIDMDETLNTWQKIKPLVLEFIEEMDKDINKL